MLEEIWKNKEWIFEGIGGVVLTIIVSILLWNRSNGQKQKSGRHSTNIQAGKDINIGDFPSSKGGHDD